MTDKLLIDRELVERIRQHLTELRELNDDLTWTDVSEVTELDGLPAAKDYGSDGVGLSHADVSSLITGEPVKDPAVLVEALEWIANFAKGAEHPNALTTGHALMMRGTAREALADWKGGLG